jgi:hypothetical protein
MNFRTALRTTLSAVKANLLPGLLLQALMLVFFAAYVSHEGTRQFLAQVADFKEQAGYAFAFVSYILSAALLPEVLKIGFFQECRIKRENIYNFLTGAPVWGCMGIIVDAFYRGQGLLFGTGNDWLTIALKLCVDQFVFSPFFSVPFVVGYFRWRDARFSRPAFRAVFTREFLTEYFLPAQVAGWCIWIPGVCLIYFMPSALQLPMAALIQAFWVLVLTFVNQRRVDKPRTSRASVRGLEHG